MVTPIPGLRQEDCPAAYSAAMLEFASIADFPGLDLGKAVASICTKLGPRRSAELYQPDGGHLSPAGAERVAAAFVQLLRNSDDNRLSVLCTVLGGRRPGQE